MQKHGVKIAVMTYDSLTVLDWGASHFAAARFSVSRKRTIRLEAWASEARVFPEGESEASVEEAARAWRRIRLRVGGTWRAVLGLSSPPVRLTPVVMVDMPAKESRQALDFEMRQVAGAAAAGTHWGVRRLGAAGDKVDYLLAMVDEHEVAFRAEILERAGFGLEAVVSQALSLTSLLACCHDAADRASALVQIGAASSHLVYQEGDRVAVRSFTMGGNSLTRTLADELSSSIAEAEELKRRLCADESRSAAPGKPTSEEESRAPMDGARDEAFWRTRELFVGRLQLELTRILLNQRTPSLPAIPVDLHLLGGGAWVPGLPERLEQKMKLTVRRFDDSDVMEWGDGQTPLRGVERLRCVDLAAVARTHCFDPSGAVNLLDAPRRRAFTLRRSQPVVAGAAALAAVALVPPLIHYQRAAEGAERQVQRIESTVRELDRNRIRIDENLRRIRKAQAEVAVWRKFASARGNWVRFLAELQANLGAAGEIWLERLQPLKVGAGLVPVTGVRLAMSGRVLEPEPAAGRTSAESRVRTFFQAMTKSPFVAALEQERFDRGEDGILGFDVVIRMNRSETL